jgi:hypothetical protein
LKEVEGRRVGDYRRCKDEVKYKRRKKSEEKEIKSR